MVDRLRVELGGWPGQPGYMNIYSFGGPGTAQAAVVAFLTSLKAYWPSGMTYTVPNSGDSFAEASGTLIGGWTGGTPTVITGTGAGVYAAPAGVQFLLKTGEVVDGRRPIGRIIICPVIGSSQDNDGSVGATLVSVGQAAINTLVAPANKIVIWHRPKFDYSVKPPTLVRPGSYVVPSSGVMSDKIIVLRSRRP